jgi:ArsR family transcriptional regulator
MLFLSSANIANINVFGYSNTYKSGNTMDSPSLAQEVTELHAEICSAMADPRRILLLYAISEEPRNVSDLADYVGISQPAASRHLKIMRERGLVNAIRHGASVEYHLTDNRLIEALDTLRDVLRDRLTYQASLVE